MPYAIPDNNAYIYSLRIKIFFLDYFKKKHKKVVSTTITSLFTSPHNINWL